MAKDTQDAGNVPFQIMLPKGVVHAIRIESAKHDLKYSEFIHQMYVFAKRNGFLDKLKEKA